MRERRHHQTLRRQLPPRRASLWPALGAALTAALLLPAVPPARGQAVQEIQPLSFGRIALGGASGTVRLEPNGTQSCSPHTCLGNGRPGSFEVVGLPLFRVTIQYSPSNPLTHQGGGGSLDLSNLRDSAGGQLDLSLLGEGRFNVGGDLQVGAGASGGAYAGSYMVTVEYQ